jgi:hypothetical protein
MGKNEQGITKLHLEEGKQLGGFMGFSQSRAEVLEGEVLEDKKGLNTPCLTQGCEATACSAHRHELISMKSKEIL